MHHQESAETALQDVFYACDDTSLLVRRLGSTDQLPNFRDDIWRQLMLPFFPSFSLQYLLRASGRLIPAAAAVSCLPSPIPWVSARSVPGATAKRLKRGKTRLCALDLSMRYWVLPPGSCRIGGQRHGLACLEPPTGRCNERLETESPFRCMY